MFVEHLSPPFYQPSAKHEILPSKGHLNLVALRDRLLISHMYFGAPAAAAAVGGEPQILLTTHKGPLKTTRPAQSQIISL